MVNEITESFKVTWEVYCIARHCQKTEKMSILNICLCVCVYMCTRRHTTSSLVLHKIVDALKSYLYFIESLGWWYPLIKFKNSNSHFSFILHIFLYICFFTKIGNQCMFNYCVEEFEFFSKQILLRLNGFLIHLPIFKAEFIYLNIEFPFFAFVK